MRQRAIRQRRLFEDSAPVPPPRLPQSIRQEAEHLLVQWLQVLAQAIGEEAHDEQDQR